MKISVSYAGPLAVATGCSEESIDLPEGATSFDLIAAVAERHPDAAAIVRSQSGGPAGGLMIIVGDRAVSRVRPEPLTSGAVVSLMPAIGGG